MGTSGSDGERSVAATASGLIEPARMWPADEPSPSNARSTWPPISADSIGPAPWYGTSTSLMPVCIANSSPARWCVLPLPAVPKLISPGRFLA
ncbi:hypothetical protein D9M69_585190 [compost metagenome]